MKFLNEIHSVTDAIEEVRIAEGNVLRAGGHLLADILHHDVAADDSKDAFVNRDDGTMAAKMFAAAAGFRRADEAESAAGNDEMSVLFDGRHIRAVWDFKIEAFERDERLGLWRNCRAIVALLGCLHTFRELREFVLEFAAENGRDT